MSLSAGVIESELRSVNPSASEHELRRVAEGAVAEIATGRNQAMLLDAIGRGIDACAKNGGDWKNVWDHYLRCRVALGREALPSYGPVSKVAMFVDDHRWERVHYLALAADVFAFLARTGAEGLASTDAIMRYSVRVRHRELIRERDKAGALPNTDERAVYLDRLHADVRELRMLLSVILPPHDYVVFHGHAVEIEDTEKGPRLNEPCPACGFTRFAYEGGACEQLVCNGCDAEFPVEGGVR